MPKIPIDEAPAGPAMDAAVAEALGYECVCDEEPLDCPIHCDEDPWTKSRYSTDIVAAWGLVEKGRLHIGPIVRDDKVITGWYCADHQDLSKAIVFVGGSSAPLAICRAFLKANGVEYVEVPE